MDPCPPLPVLLQYCRGMLQRWAERSAEAAQVSMVCRHDDKDFLVWCAAGKDCYDVSVTEVGWPCAGMTMSFTSPERGNAQLVHWRHMFTATKLDKHIKRILLVELFI